MALNHSLKPQADKTRGPKSPSPPTDFAQNDLEPGPHRPAVTDISVQELPCERMLEHRLVREKSPGARVGGTRSRQKARRVTGRRLPVACARAQGEMCILLPSCSASFRPRESRLRDERMGPADGP